MSLDPEEYIDRFNHWTDSSKKPSDDRQLQIHWPSAMETVDQCRAPGNFRDDITIGRDSQRPRTRHYRPPAFVIVLSRLMPHPPRF
jgi:hypothetical protein